MIRRIRIDNFKSLDGFSLPPEETAPLTNFTCIIGKNGSGKTSVLQMFDYLAHLLSGEIVPWRQIRGWSPHELRSRFAQMGRASLHYSFEIELYLDGLGLVTWQGQTRGILATDEKITVNGKLVLNLSKGTLLVNPLDGEPMEIDVKAFRLIGSCLNSFDDSILSPELIRTRAAMQAIHSLELLSPGAMRVSSRPSDDIGRSGEHLAGFFAKLKGEQRSNVVEKVQRFFPELLQVNSPSKEYGWRTLQIRELGVPYVTSKHLSDGFLRILAIISQLEQIKVKNDRDSVILLDEIENGLHPELIEGLVQYLLQSEHQIIVTTHSPMILNYLPNERAKESMIFLYRNKDWRTRACRYFDLPTASKKLGLLGPGEVYVDTSMDVLVQEAESLSMSKGRIQDEDRQ